MSVLCRAVGRGLSPPIIKGEKGGALEGSLSNQEEAKLSGKGGIGCKRKIPVLQLLQLEQSVVFTFTNLYASARKGQHIDIILMEIPTEMINNLARASLVFLFFQMVKIESMDERLTPQLLQIHRIPSPPLLLKKALPIANQARNITSRLVPISPHQQQHRHLNLKQEITSSQMMWVRYTNLFQFLGKMK